MNTVPMKKNEGHPRSFFECEACKAKNRIVIDPDEGDYQQTVVACNNCGRDNILEISIDPTTGKTSIIVETE